MLQKLILTALLTVSASIVLAAEDITYSCTKDSATRTIAVEYQNEAAKVPCQVTYQKGSGEKATLWSAQNQEDYCEEKAVAFVQKQSVWGWKCSSN